MTTSCRYYLLDGEALLEQSRNMAVLPDAADRYSLTVGDHAQLMLDFTELGGVVERLWVTVIHTGGDPSAPVYVGTLRIPGAGRGIGVRSGDVVAFEPRHVIHLRRPAALPTGGQPVLV